MCRTFQFDTRPLQDFARWSDRYRARYTPHFTDMCEEQLNPRKDKQKRKTTETEKKISKMFSTHANSFMVCCHSVSSSTECKIYEKSLKWFLLFFFCQIMTCVAYALYLILYIQLDSGCFTIFFVSFLWIGTNDRHLDDAHMCISIIEMWNIKEPLA